MPDIQYSDLRVQSITGCHFFSIAAVALLNLYDYFLTILTRGETGKLWPKGQILPITHFCMAYN